MSASYWKWELVVIASVVAIAGAAGSRPINLGINIDPSNPAGNPTANDVQDLGAGWVRLEYKDNAPIGSPPSPDNVTEAANIIKQFHQAGISTLLILDYSSLLGRPTGSASPAAWENYSIAFSSRSTAVVAGIYQASGSSGPAAVEIWNEPDLQTVGNVPADAFGPLLERAYKAIKATSPSTTVVLGGLATGDPTYLQQVGASTGGTIYADAIGVHTYGQRPSSAWPNPTWGFGVLTDLLARYHEVQPTKELWVTEYGTTDPNARPTFPAHAFAAVAANASSGECNHVFWFCWSDGMVNGFGVVDNTGQKKPSYTSFSEYAHNQSYAK